MRFEDTLFGVCQHNNLSIPNHQLMESNKSQLLDCLIDTKKTVYYNYMLETKILTNYGSGMQVCRSVLDSCPIEHQIMYPVKNRFLALIYFDVALGNAPILGVGQHQTNNPKP